MREIVESNRVFGIEVSKTTLSFAEVVKKGGRIKLSSIKTLPIAEVEGDEVLSVSEMGKDLINKAEANMAVFGVEATDCLVRQLQVPLKKDSEINDALPFQAETLLPFPLEDAVLDWIKVQRDDKTTLLTFAAVKRETAEKTIEQAKKLGIEPELLSTMGAALASFSKHLVNFEAPHFVIHFGGERALYALINKGRLIATQGSKLNLKEILKAAGEDMGESDPARIEEAFRNIDLLHLEPAKYPRLSACLIETRLDLSRNVFGLAKQLKGESVDDALVTGAAFGYPSLKAYLLKEAEKAEIPLETTEDFPLNLEDLALNALPIGLALQGVDASLQINFRQGAISYPKPLKRVVKPLLFYLGSSLLFALALFLAGSAYFSYRESGLRQEYIDLLASMNRTYEESEAEFEGIKDPGEGYVPQPVDKLDVSDLTRRLDKLEKSIKTAPDFIALNPNIPRVSDVLAWLSTHPNVGFEGGGSKESDAIVIELFNYSLVKRPEEKKRDARYQAKVEIEFVSPSPKLAREFHDALIAPNDMVDPKGEIKWSSTRGKYRTSFFLKDKTYYPSQRSL
ncbi:hypothetical protein [Estrella lausannensis]|uniref:Type IV pilus assembly protein PilM n=1 Tax=Estrella lausannensis TaxID=483423 RepID=A0A0H5DMX6_9BACT|nr:hypothetical protein [Estrella lausannensis]CRX37541.1 Conserved hypothetical protein [Estrella lausannensis]